VLGRQIVELQGECSRLQESLQQRAQEHVGLSAAAASVQQQADTWKSLLHERIEGRTVAENVLESLWSALPDARAEFMADSAEFRRQLQEKFAQLRNLREQLADATQSLRQPESQIPELLKDLQLAEKAWLQHQQEYGDAQQDLNHLQQQLQQLLGAQSAEQFRQTIENREQSARKKLDDAAIVRSEADKARTAAATQYQTLQHQLESETQAETTARSTLNTWLGKFSPDSGLDQALTELRQLLTHDSDWIEDERRALDKFSSEVNAAAGESNSCRQRLDEYLRQRTDDRDEAAVLEAIEVQRQRVENAEAERQDARLILQKDDDTRGKNLELDGRITAAELAAKPWLELNQLIGSADGKTFTLMAQRYTLDLLLQHANVQLRELARRYRLERLGDSLNLAVIDQDLGDELRSVHSLSGGETFLVSLALALGLASLTSSRLRIESLFIDEGFGSLDEDTLEVAMNALNHLQSQGRKVGIITHVERMQDAITTRIQIRRGPGSTSRIVLPRAASAESHD
jgi:exonuclease SbcC